MCRSVLILLLAGVTPRPAAAADAPRPNVVLIVADDLGWSDLACYGADLHETPAIDRLAASGVRFTRAFAAPVCSPTRAALMTGKNPARLHMTTWYESSGAPPRDRPLVPPVTVGNLPYAEVTLAELFREAGYTTALVGKWHLGDARFYPETQGFDVNVGGTHWGAPKTFFYPYRGVGRYGGETEFRYVPHLDGGKPGEYLTDRLTDEALGVIDRAGDRPFFLVLAHHAPHTPIEAKPALVEHYRSKLRPGQRHKNPAYAAMIHSLDESVGRVVAHLEKKNLSERTVVIFTSDNGGYISEFDGLRVTDNAPLRSGKGSLYEGGVRVPLIVRWPGVTPRSAECGEMVGLFDLFPTLRDGLNLSGGPTPATGLDGVSLLETLKDPAKHVERDDLFLHFPHYYPTTTPVSAVRTREWKYLEYYETGRGELYKVDTDTGESNDLARNEPGRAEELRNRLHRWLKEVDAQMPERRR
ncbi:MAG: sulfatase [Isosphaeraceae bacterium]